LDVRILLTDVTAVTVVVSDVVVFVVVMRRGFSEAGLLGRYESVAGRV